MTPKSVGSNQLERLERKTAEVSRRVREGTLPFDPTMHALQKVVEGRGIVGAEVEEISVWLCSSLTGLLGDPNWVYVDKDLTEELFPTQKYGEPHGVDMALFHFGREVTSQQVVSEMEKKGYRPATAFELLCLLDTMKVWRGLMFPVVALGQVCRLFSCHTLDYVVVCDGWDGLRIYEANGGCRAAWRSCCYFAAVRKE